MDLTHRTPTHATPQPPLTFTSAMTLALPHVRRQPKFAYGPVSRGGSNGSAGLAVSPAGKDKHHHHRGSSSPARRLILPALVTVVVGTALVLIGTRKEGHPPHADGSNRNAKDAINKQGGETAKVHVRNQHNKGSNDDDPKHGAPFGIKSIDLGGLVWSETAKVYVRNQHNNGSNDDDPKHPPSGIKSFDLGGLCTETKTGRCTVLHPAGDLSDYVPDEAVRHTGPVKVEAAIQLSYESGGNGDDSDARPLSAILTRRGAGIGHEINQDRSFVLQLPHADFAVGIFDGHGENGHYTSHYANQQLPRMLANELSSKAKDDVAGIQKVLTESFLEVDSNVDEMAGALQESMVASGSTAIVALSRGQHIYVANTGDSLAFVVRRDRSTGETEIVYRTKQHKPDLPEERERIEGSGGEILMPPAWATGDSPRVLTPLSQEDKDLGVMPIGLAMSRSIGDRELKKVGVIADPTIDVIDINSLAATKGDELFVVAATDGLYDHVDPEILAKRLGGALSSQKLMLSTMEELIMEASNVWLRLMQGETYRDDISLAVVKI